MIHKIVAKRMANVCILLWSMYRTDRAGYHCFVSVYDQTQSSKVFRESRVVLSDLPASDRNVIVCLHRFAQQRKL